MQMKSRKLLIASGVAIALAGLGGAAVADTTSQEVIDARQETQIWTTYASPYLRANDIKVSVKNGTATLTGNVEEDVSKDLAKQIALGVDGVKVVENEIVVDRVCCSEAIGQQLRRNHRRRESRSRSALEAGVEPVRRRRNDQGECEGRQGDVVGHSGQYVSKGSGCQPRDEYAWCGVGRQQPQDRRHESNPGQTWQ